MGISSILSILPPGEACENGLQERNGNMFSHPEKLTGWTQSIRLILKGKPPKVFIDVYRLCNISVFTYVLLVSFINKEEGNEHDFEVLKYRNSTLDDRPSSRPLWRNWMRDTLNQALVDLSLSVLAARDKETDLLRLQKGSNCDADWKWVQVPLAVFDQEVSWETLCHLVSSEVSVLFSHFSFGSIISLGKHR